MYLVTCTHVEDNLWIHEDDGHTITKKDDNNVIGEENDDLCDTLSMASLSGGISTIGHHSGPLQTTLLLYPIA